MNNLTITMSNNYVARQSRLSVIHCTLFQSKTAFTQAKHPSFIVGVEVYDEHLDKGYIYIKDVLVKIFTKYCVCFFNRISECKIKTPPLSDVINHDPVPIPGLQFLSQAPRDVQKHLKDFTSRARTDILEGKSLKRFIIM